MTNDATDLDDRATTDGRRLRRERGRAAVIEALIELLYEGIISPTGDQISERAGVSTMSVYRYFDGADDLRRAAIASWFDRYPSLLDIDRIGLGDVSDRIGGLVDARLELYETAEPFGRLFRVRAHTHQQARDMLAMLSAGHLKQLREHFAVELSVISSDDAARLIAVISTLTSFESWNLLRVHHGFGHDEIRRTWIVALDGIFAAL